MRITVLQLLLAGAFVISASAGNLHGQGILDQRISLSEKGQNLKKVLHSIEQIAAVRFTYDSRLVASQGQVNLNVKNEELKNVLDRLLSPLSIRYEVVNDQIVLQKKEVQNSDLNDDSSIEMQKPTVRGKVMSGKDGSPIAGVSVTVEGTKWGVTTDGLGGFEIQAKEGDILVFSAVGYVTRRIAVGRETTLSIKMEEGKSELGEVVVTALGIKRSTRSLGYSEEQIGGTEIAKSNAPNVINALSGKMAGVNITNPNGVDGGSTRIIIGGNNTITGDNQPLIIVDGMPMDNTIPASAQDVTAPRDWGSAINLINPQDIEEMSVLKGPAAAALYGGRGANGVILITTKKGAKRNGLGVDYNFAYKSVEPYRYIKMQNEYGAGGMVSLNAPQYQTDASGNPILTDGWNQMFVDQKTGSGPYGVAVTDQVSWTGSGVSWGPKMDGTEITWWDGTKRADVPQPDNVKSYYRNGNQASHNVSISGGNEWGTLRASFTTLDNNAIIPNSNYSQNSFNIGTAMKLSKRVNVLVNASYFNNAYHNAPALGNTEGTLQSNLVYAYSRNYTPSDIEDYKLPNGARNNFTGFPWYGNGGAQYLYWNTYENNETQTRRKLIGSAQLNYQVTDFLDVMGRASTDANNDEDYRVNNTTDVTGTIGGSFGHGLTRDIAQNYDWLATLHKDHIGQSNISAKFSLGGTFYKRSMYSISASSGATYANPNLYYFGNYSGATQPDQVPTESWYDEALNSVYGFLNLSYKNYLYLDITGRNDWSSTLPKNQWSYFFPSFTASYIFSDAWHIDPNVLSFGKFRAAYAEGAVGVGPYTINTIFNTGSFAGQPTSSLPSTLPAANYKPQVNQTADFGVTLGFLHNRLNFDGRYYNGRAIQQLLQSPLPQSSGLTSITVNTGVLQNSGLEMIARARVIDRPSIKWDVSLNLSKNYNRLISLTAGATRVDMANIYGASGNYVSAVVGKEFGAIMGYDYVYDPKTHKPLLQDAAQIQQNFNVDAGTAASMKGTMYQSTATIVPIGNATPKFYGGITNTLSLKGGFSVSALVDCKVGGQMWSGTYASMMQQGNAPETLKERDGGGLPYTTPDGTATKWGVILPGVYPDGTVNTTVVHYYYKYMAYGVWSSGPNGNNWIHSTGVLKDTWYKLRELSLNYAIPDRIVRKTKAIQAATVSLVGRDLFYLYSSLPDHINPEGSNGAGNAQGIEFASLPGARSVGVQVSVSF